MLRYYLVEGTRLHQTALQLMISYVQQWNRTHDPLHTTSLKGIQLTATYSTDTNKLTEVDELYIDCWWLLRADHIACEITNDQLTSPSHFWHHLLTTYSFLINTHSPLHLFPTTLCYWLTTKHTSKTKQKLSMPCSLPVWELRSTNKNEIFSRAQKQFWPNTPPDASMKSEFAECQP